MSCSRLSRPLTVWSRDPSVAGTTLFPERAARVSADDPAVARWDVQVAGHLCVDLVPRLLDAADVTPGALIEVGPLDQKLGGCVGNTGPDLAALGLRTLLVASLGDDVLAGTVAALIDAVPGADARVEIMPGATTSYSVVVQPRGLTAPSGTTWGPTRPSMVGRWTSGMPPCCTSAISRSCRG
jgi:hypothetical protein